MDIKLHITRVLPVQTIHSNKNNNDYPKYAFVGETEDKFPRTIMFSMFNPDMKNGLPQVDDIVMASVDIESRPFTGKDGVERWSTSVEAYNIMYVNGDGSLSAAKNRPWGNQSTNTAPAQSPMPQQQGYYPQQPTAPQPAKSADDLPF